jgi:hypothetical protein
MEEQLPLEEHYGWYYNVKDAKDYFIKVCEPFNSFDRYSDVVAEIIVWYRNKEVWHKLVSVTTDWQSLIKTLREVIYRV